MKLNGFNSDLMKKWIFVLAVLALIIAVSGCTTSQQVPANKTYSVSGLSFIYSGTWSDLDKTAYQSVLNDKGEILAVVGDGSTVFGVARLNKIKNQTDITLNSLILYYNATLNANGTKYVSEGPVTVDGVKGYKMTVKASENYLSGVLFIKNHTAYLAVFESSDNDQKIFNQILNSLKIP
jgi:hypothetical protein